MGNQFAAPSRAVNQVQRLFNTTLDAIKGTGMPKTATKVPNVLNVKPNVLLSGAAGAIAPAAASITASTALGVPMIKSMGQPGASSMSILGTMGLNAPEYKNPVTGKEPRPAANLPADYKETEQAAGETADKHRPGAGFSSFTPLDGGNNSPPPRVAAKRPTSVKEAYETLGHGAVGGGFAYGMQMGRLGDVWSPTAETAIAYGGVIPKDGFGGNIPIDIDLAKETYGNPYNYGELKRDAGSQVNPFATDVSKGFGTDYTGTSETQRDSMQALRAREQELGIVYASGKHWVDGPDGKLQEVKGSNGMTARERVQQFKRGNLNLADIGGRLDGEGTSVSAPAVDPKPVQTGTVPETDLQGPSFTEPTKTTTQTPLTPFGQVPADFEGLKLPGGIYDTGRELAEKAGGWYGREKAKEKGGNLPFIGGMIQDYGERKGTQRGGEFFDQTAGKFKGLFQQ